MASFRSRIVQHMLRDLKEALIIETPIIERRRRLDAIARSAIRLPRNASLQSVTAGDISADWITPNDCIPYRAILYLHGGAYSICSPITHRGLTGRIACTARMPVLAIDYRLAPEHPFPAALEDTIGSYHWLVSQGYEPKQIALGGDSAGGGLALATALALRDRKISLPGALFLLSPWTDLTSSGASIRERAERDPLLKAGEDDLTAREYAGSTPLDHPYISPLLATHHNLPPCLIQVGTEEILFDDSSRLGDKLDAAGVKNWFEVWNGMWHVFQGFAPYVPEAQQAIDRIGTFLDQNLTEET